MADTPSLADAIEQQDVDLVRRLALDGIPDPSYQLLLQAINHTNGPNVEIIELLVQHC